jgi:hypothetical protein
MTYILFILAIFAGLLLFDYFKTRDLARGRDILKETQILRDDLEHMKHRVEHLEAIIADQDSDFSAEPNSFIRQKSKE